MAHPHFLLDQQTYGSSYVAEPSVLTRSIWEDVSESEFGNSPMGMSSSVPLIPEEYWPSYSTPFGNTSSTIDSSTSANLGWDHQGTFNKPCHIPSKQSSLTPSYSNSTLPAGFIELVPNFPRLQIHPDTFELDTSSICSSAIVGSPGPLSPQSSFLPPPGHQSGLYQNRDNSEGHCLSEQQRAGAQYDTETEASVHPLSASFDTNTNAPAPPLECCGHRFSSQSSFDRHRKDHCKTFPPVEPKRFQCQVHCQKAYSRRCSLKKHLKSVGYDTAVVDGLVRARYGKGMHRRPNKPCTL